ncbi:GNAT family N-acetyltransferase [Salipaludibacillus agaradhaerens]|jgi:GNAT superfamily N-acetyltransferase|uniref:GNAT family N-acetyltransferase n=1 Tax=Salipaludibacillus agaradhaerens TaxID=76935 RepID=UPI00099855DF|nr:GNAT family N-acetyltransferase [Salipaludibacillus agaradhaerens]
MLTIQLAEPKHVSGIVTVCSEAYRTTYRELCDHNYIERTIQTFYNEKRVLNEINETSDEWGGWIIACEGEAVVGAIGGGMTSAETGEVFVLYIDPSRRHEGIGTKLLERLTDWHKQQGAKWQWVSVMKNNDKGIPFYEAKGFRQQHDQKTYQSAVEENIVSHRYCREI